MTTPKVAIQARLWGLERVAADYKSVFDEVIQAGYDGVEARYALAEDESLPDYLASQPLELVALHANLGGFDPENPQRIDLERLLGQMNVLGSSYLLVSFGKRPHYTKWFELAAGVSEQCAAQEVTFCYHNHADEFLHTGFFDDLTAHGVALAADLAWVWRAGQDVGAFVDRYADAIKYVHVKDATMTAWRELGQGDMELHPLLERLKALTLPWWTVEQDSTEGEPSESSRISRDFLRQHGV